MSKKSKKPKFDNSNKGAAWKHEARSEKSPQFSGQLDVDGVTYWIAVWQPKKPGKKQPKLRFAITLKE